MLLRRFGGRVPATMEELLTLPGVGRKTANLVLILSFKSRREHLRRHARAPHRESARLGADADAGGNREGALQDRAEALVAIINLYLVTWGQNVCRPVYPRCGRCAARSVPAKSASRHGRDAGRVQSSR